MSESLAEGIAIVGMAGRFPGASNLDEFWRNLVAGTESISTFNDEELTASGLDAAALRRDPHYVAARGIVEGAALFDAPFFGMTAKEAEVTDPQQRLFLEVAWHALENAGYDPDRIKGLIGVYCGVGINTYGSNLRGRTDLVDLVGEELITLGNEKDYLATRVAYKLNLRGPALNVNTACSTALVAVGQACQALLQFQCDLALAGGVSVTFPQKRGALHQEGGFASPDGHTRAFDAQAQGTIFSDGLGVVALKRLAEAIEDGDQIYAVVKGVGINNDGSAKVGFTAPSVGGQAEAIALAQADAGIDPDTLSYIECHGTATPIGDPIEIAALTQAFRMRTKRKNFCAIGSVKSNIGHLGAAAGAAGLIKTALALKHQTLPPSLHYAAPNPKIDFANSPFFVNTKLTDWKTGKEPRRAGVSSFGFGGTNAHLVLEEAPKLEPSGSSREWQLLVLSAKSEAALNDATTHLAAHFETDAGVNLADAAHTLQVGRRVFQHRRILVCNDTADAATALGKSDPKRLLSYVHNTESAAPSVVFMFPGQGSQYVGMGADLYRTEPVFKEQIDRCAEILRPAIGLDLRDVLYPTPDKTKAAEELLLQTRITQPALFAIEYALAQLWMSWGIKPAALTGHSLGEYVAACLAGVFTLEDALTLVAQRGDLIQTMPSGSMLAVPMPEDELKTILPPALSIAGVNGPAQCVVSGPSADIDAFLAKLTADGKTGRPLRTSHAFHSAMMDPVLERFADCVRGVKRSEPTIPFISNLTGTWISPEEARDPHYWARHLRQGVRFADGVKELLKNEAAVFLEAGPGTTLGSLVKFQAKKTDNRAILSSLRHAREEQPDLSTLLTALGQLWMRGTAVDWTAFRGDEKRHRVTLPGYAFQRERYWIERHVPAPAEAVSAPQNVPDRKPDIADWFYLPTWKRSELATPVSADLLPHPLVEWLLFVDESGIGEKFATKLTARYENVTIVRIGTTYKKISDGVYAINPERAEDYVSLITDLDARDKIPGRIVHFWGVTESDDNTGVFERTKRAQTLGLHSLLHLVRALRVSEEIDLGIVANNVHPVTGDEKLAPEKATLIGAAKVIPQEYTNIRCRCVGIIKPEPASKDETRLLQQLLTEFSAVSSEPVVAYRGGYRWIKRFDAVRLESSGKTASRLKTNGVYLITGGLGGVGLALAESLAASVRPKLILIGRSTLPLREQWSGWLTAHSHDDATSAKIRKIQTLESAGAECLVFAANVADRDAIQKVIAEAKKRFGRIDGVIHAAGSPDLAGVIQRRSRQATDDMLAPKIQGTLALEEALAGEKLDFLVLCSTLGNVILGGKFGQVGYAAANEFLDAYASSKKAGDAPYTVSINWDNWSDVGMAADILRDQLREGKRARVLTNANSLNPAEGAEAFNRILGHSFAQIAVSVADLESRARRLNSATIYQEPAAAVEKATPAPVERHARPTIASDFVAPVNDTEQVLAGIWQELLGIDVVGVDDTFFELGGDSLLLMRVQVKIRQSFETDLTSAEMFQFPTIGALAKRLGNRTAKVGPKPAAAQSEDRTLQTTVVDFPRTPKDDSQAIAIIGLAGRFPGAANVDEYWRNLAGGVESISTFTDEELAAAGLNVAEIRGNPSYVASRGILDDPDLFDASFFNFGSREAEITDPQQRLFLEAAWEALENAGYDPARARGYVGVFAGMGNNTYFVNNLQSHPELLEQAGRMAIIVGNEKDYVASRTAYKLNLKGPALSTNTACSTSLVNVCLAAQSLLSRQCDLALAGGVSVSFPQKRANFHQEGGIFSPDGHCRPFDAHAAGTYFSDGLGVVVLKRLSDALRDGDQIHAVVKGVGFNNDGADKIGFTAPGVQGQAEVITLAQAHAGVGPESISYIETHGTATPLGDPIEIAALTQAFRSGTAKKGFCAIGSVKGNIGHLDAAAGVAGLIKTTLALKHRKLPPTVNFSTPNPKIDFANSPFFVNAKLTDWKAGSTPRRAGVSAFGIGGTNAHVVLEEAPAPRPPAPSRGAQLLVFSAKTATALDSATSRFLAHLKANPEINLADAAYTLQVGRRVFPHRRMLVARHVPDAIRTLETMDPKRVLTRHVEAKDCPVVFMFPGQGAQYLGMGADLYRTEQVFRAEVDRCAEILAGPLDLDLRKVLFPVAGEEKMAEKLLIETRIAQPALFVIDYALAKLWTSWGVKPQAMLSHSLGEFVAACLAGVFTLEEALTAVAARSQLVQELPHGAMVAVRLPEEELAPLLPETLSIAALNSPALSVVAGPFEATEKFEAQLKTKGVISRRLDSSHAFHSAMMDPVTEPFAEQLRTVNLQPPDMPYVSNITGRWITPKEATDPHYWATHARETVRFADGLGEILKDPQRALLEVGPGRALATFANQHQDKSTDRVVVSSILPSNEPEIVEMLNALGRLWLAGKPVDWSGFYVHEKRQRIPLPTYPFERKRFWIEPNRTSAPTSTSKTGALVEGSDHADETAPAITTALPRKDRLVEALRTLFHEVSGLATADITPSVNFLELGFDSLSLSQVSQMLEKKYGVRIAFRQMLEELSTIDELALYLSAKLPPDFTADSAPARPAPAALSAQVLEAQILDLNRQLDAVRRSSAITGPAPAVKPTESSAASAAEFPLSESQVEVWLSSQTEDASRAFNQVFSLTMPDRLDHGAMLEILQQLVEHHDALRTTFAPDGSSQRVSASARIELPLRDLCASSAAEGYTEIAVALAQEGQFLFDLANGPLLRVQMFRLSGERCALVFNAHHIILDGWSIAVLLREFTKLYQARVNRTPVELEPAMQYHEYMDWLSSPAHEAAEKTAEAYWLKQFATIPNEVELPTDRPRPPIRTYRAAQKQITLEPALYRAIKETAAAKDSTLYIFLAASLKAWLSRLTAREDLVMGIPSAGQLAVTGHANNRALIGHCVSALPLRTQCSGNLSFAEHLKNVKAAMLDAQENQSLTIATIVRKLHLAPDPSRPQLIPMVLHVRRASRLLPLPDAEVTFPARDFTFFDLHFEATDSGKDLIVDCRYNSDLYDGDRIERMLGHLRTLITAAVANPGLKLTELPLLTEVERGQILTEWNKTEADFPMDLCAHDLIEEHAIRTPDAEAVVLGQQKLTYRELNTRANQLARHLQKLGVGPETAVGLSMERTPEMIVGMYAILKAGGAYLPLDPKYPPDRLAFMIEDSSVKLILTQKHLQSVLPAGKAQFVCLDADWETISRESATPVIGSAMPGNLAYIIYTSGSTGRPKGVLLEHRGLTNLAKVHWEEFQISPGDRVLQFASISFDASVSEIFSALSRGAAICLAKPEQLLPGPELIKLLHDQRVNVVTLPPTVLNAISEENLPDLRTVISAGEACTLEMARRWGRGRRFINAYGPTEGTVCSTLQVITPEQAKLTIGRPIANFQVHILDEQLRPVPVGFEGELHIGGVGLARGYHNRPELTEAKFIRNPFSSDPKARLYKTGDLARYLPDGTIEYLGRLDHQVKIRGFRIELGEIEEVINLFPGVGSSVVMAREDSPGDKRLIAYLVGKEAEISPAALREFLKAKLPDYMVPSAFVALPSFPLTPNGKVDRKALPKPNFESGADKSKFIAPSTPSEIAIAQIWCEVLGLKQVGVNDNFFDLGGHSMLAVRLVNKIRQALDFTVPIPVFFQNPTIRKIAVVYDQHQRETPGAARDSHPPLVTFQAGGTRVPVFFLHGDWGGSGLYCGYLAQGLGPDQPLHALSPYRSGKQSVITVEEMVEHHVKVIREHTPNGPYIIGGYCVGATLAVEVARELMAQGQKVEHLLLVDPPRGKAPSLHGLWSVFDIFGRIMGRDLLTRINHFDHYGVSILRWYRFSLRGKLQGIGRRLGLTDAGSSVPVTAGDRVELGEPDILSSLDYALYFLSSCLFSLEPIKLPATVYFPKDTSYSSSREARAKELFTQTTIELIPGTHHTCISQNAGLLAAKMKRTLDGVRSSEA
jgi:amino acid adenylation domain-containing protein